MSIFFGDQTNCVHFFLWFEVATHQQSTTEKKRYKVFHNSNEKKGKSQTRKMTKHKQQSKMQLNKPQVDTGAAGQLSQGQEHRQQQEKEQQ